MDLEKIIPPVDLNKPVENPILKKAIEEFVNTKATMILLDLWYKLTTANYLLATFNVPGSGKIEEADGSGLNFGQGSQIALFSYHDPEKKKFLMAFTDWEEIRRHTSKNVNALVMPSKELSDFLLKDEFHEGIVINPSGKSLMLHRNHLKIISELINK